MTKKAYIAELELEIERLKDELANLRGQPMLLYGRVIQPYLPVPCPSTITLPIEIHRYERTIPTDNPFIVMAIRE